MSAVTKGVQTATANRWGDYSALFVDPADECTFWGAFEYVDSPTATFDWDTRVFSFKVNPTCVTAPRGTINGTITNCGNGQPILNAVITTPEGFLRQTNASGQFSIIVTPGTYTVTASAPGTGFGNCTATVTVAANARRQSIAVSRHRRSSLSRKSLVQKLHAHNGAIDPGETVTGLLCQNSGGLAHKPRRYIQAKGGSPARGHKNYGAVPATIHYRLRNFTFTASGTCARHHTALFSQDGAPTRHVTYTFTLGAPEHRSPRALHSVRECLCDSVPAGVNIPYHRGVALSRTSTSA